jgi:CrcB protein
MALVGVGGALGALLRWGLAELIDTAPDAFPWSTLLVNVLGCLLIGVASRRLAPATDAWFAGVSGALGGFTTFSTFANEARTLAELDRPMLAVVYVGVTLVAGLIGVELGRAAAR